MPKLSTLTDAYVDDPMGSGLPVVNPYFDPNQTKVIIPTGEEKPKVEEPSALSSNIDKILNSLFRDDENRLQLWPEKVVREALSGAKKVMSGEIPQWEVDPATGEVHTSSKMVETAQSMAALAGTGGLAGTTEGTLGATPFLRPALKYKDRLYKGKEGQQHLDVIPEALYPEFQKMAMSGEDISHYNFGFVNDKGHFLDREKALRYAIDTGMVDKFAGQYGALTSTLLSDSSKPGMAIEAVGKSAKLNYETILKNQRNKENYMAAIKGPDGKIYTTEMNSHFDILKNNPELKNYGKIGFINDKGKFITKNENYQRLSKYPELFSDSSKPSMSIESLAKSRPMEALIAKKSNSQMNADTEVLKNPSQKELRNLAKENSNIRTMTDNDGNLYAWDANKATHEGIASSLNIPVKNWGNEWFSDKGKLINKGDIKEGYPSWLKSGMLLSDSTKPGMAIEAMGKSNPFFSALEHNVAKISQNKMTGDQWLGTLSNKPGVKPEELDWTGLKSFLEENKGKPVTKGQIEEHLAANKVELKEVVKGSSEAATQEKAFELAKEHGWKSWNEIDAATQAKYMERASRDAGGVPTKHHQWQLPGGENYREMLLTLPQTKLSAETAGKNLYDNFVYKGGGQTWEQLAPETRQHWMDRATEQGRGTDFDPSKTYRSSHWDEPNILAHVRMNDRDIGGKKSLHLEEIQSDWHQQGRDKGYKVDNSKIEKEYREATKYANSLDKSDPNYGSAWEKAAKLGNQLSAKPSTGVPDAPFKKTWHELALKRMIREAAERGMDRLSWTPGEAQAARYDLSKQVDSIRAIKRQSDGNYTLAYIPKGEKNIGENSFRALTPDTVPENKLADFVGKELAAKIIKDGGGKYSDLDLKIGGEGMKGFYDQIIPKALEKLGKEHGVKVRTIYKHEGNPTEAHRKFIDDMTNQLHDELYNDALKEGFDKDKAKRFADKHTANIEPWQLSKALNKNDELNKVFQDKLDFEKHGKQPVHYIDIPQSLKDTALHKGFPLFSSTHMFIPVDHEPDFGDKNASQKR